MMEVWEISLTCSSPFHSTGMVAGSFIKVLRGYSGASRSHQVPYIPATHVKGVMRCEAERIMRTVAGVSCYITGDPSSPDHRVTPCKEVLDGGFGCPVCILFGVPNVEGGGGYREGKVRVLDFYPADAEESVLVERRSHVMINRDFQVKEEHALYSEEAVPAGTVFSGHLIIRAPLSDEEERLLKGSLHAMAGYGIGKNRSRGFGRVIVGDIRKTDRVMYPGVKV